MVHDASVIELQQLAFDIHLYDVIGVSSVEPVHVKRINGARVLYSADLLAVIDGSDFSTEVNHAAVMVCKIRLSAS